MSSDPLEIAERLAQRLASAAGPSVRSVLLYGSHMLGAPTDEHSALDFVVVVDGYRPFYNGLRASGELHRWVWLMSGMSNVLPPNVIAFAPDRGRSTIAKCLVVDAVHLERALGPNPPDHFLLGRLVQKVGVVWAATEADRLWLLGQLDTARARVLDWMAPYLEGPVTGQTLGQRLLEVCYGGELRPEAKDRSKRVFDAQSEHFGAVLTPVLEAAVARGLMTQDGVEYRLTEPATPSARRRWKRHFTRSKVRATARWFKHTLTFDNWLPYVVRKVERHTGSAIELTTLERRLPVIFLWPRAIRVLRNRPRREVLR